MHDPPPHDLAANTENAKAFYDLMFNRCEPQAAIDRYTGAQYRQHWDVLQLVPDAAEMAHTNGMF